jgi:uncharacterized protein
MDWDCFLASGGYSVGSASKKVVRNEVALSKAYLAEGNHQYFRKKLRARHVWRAYESFKNCAVFLDIETDGTADADGVTCIGLYDGKDYVCLQRGEDLESFRDRISHYSMIVTFFGTGFDLPVIMKRFPGLILDQIHFDLCPALKELGFRGGLKKIEKEFGIIRSPETEGLNGYDAVKLWRAAQRGNDNALELFVQYNKEDTVNLMLLAEKVYEEARLRMMAGVGIRNLTLDLFT